MPFTESIVEDATLNWFGDLDNAFRLGQEIAPGEAAAERISFGEAFLPGRLRDALLPKLLSGGLRLPAKALAQAGVPAKLVEVQA